MVVKVESADNLREQELALLDTYKRGLSDAPVLYRAGGYFKADDVAGAPMVFVASEESDDRMGDIISIAGWNLDEFKKNPVYLWAHNHLAPPIGKVAKVWAEGKQLLNMVEFDQGDDFAKFIQGKYQRKMLRAQSVGFRALEFEERKDEKKGMHFTKTELLEISAVSVPAHPNALAKSALAYKATFMMYGLPIFDEKAISKANKGKLGMAIGLINEVLEGPAPAEPVEIPTEDDKSVPEGIIQALRNARR